MAMSFETFKASLNDGTPPPGLNRALGALWHVAKGNWSEAHELAQAQDDAAGAWVHAHLHRIEGDESNAGYWYRRAGRAHAKAPLQEEWEQIAKALLDERAAR